MAKKKNLDLLISRIKSATGLKQDGIAQSIRYSRAHFSTLKTAESEELYDLLAAHFAEALESKMLLEDFESKYNPAADKDPLYERAMLQVYHLEIAKLKAKIYGISVESASDELTQNTKLALKQMKDGKR